MAHILNANENIKENSDGSTPSLYGHISQFVFNIMFNNYFLCSI